MGIEKEHFGLLPDGRSADKYTLKNSNGMSAEILTYGCRVYRLFVPDRDGKSENVVLGHKTLPEYDRDDDFFGAVVGRCANRIAGAEFAIGKNTYRLVKNEGRNSLHSAPGGYQNRIWSVKETTGGGTPSITLSCLDKNGECGYPGNVAAEVKYSLSAGNALSICYSAKTDKETIFAPTNHTFFNITGNPGRDILSLTLQIDADCITEADKELIPTGKLLPVKGTPYDFRRAKPVGRDIFADDAFLKSCGGYDNNFALNGEPRAMKKAAWLYDAVSGRKMEVATDMPGLQIFTANSYHEGSLGYDGREMEKHHAICLETQFFPDSVHHPDFPFQTLKPGAEFKSETIYSFTVEKA